MDAPVAATQTAGGSPSSSSSSPWYLSGKTWLLVGGAALVCGGLALILRRRAPPQPHQRDEYEDILKSLRSSALHHQTLALKQLYEYSRYPKKHDSIRHTGVLEILLQILAEHPGNDMLLLHLTRVVANLAINHENRLVLGRLSTVYDLFYLLECTENRIKEHILRCLLNLSLEETIEDVIRETGGLVLLCDMFSSEETSPTVLFQTTRVLLNLVHNAKNKAVMIQEGLVQRAVQRLTSGSPGTENLDFYLRLVNLVGLFAVDCASDVLGQIATKETAEAFIKLLEIPQNSDHVSTVLQATMKILARKHSSDVQPFIDAFGEKKDDQHPSGVENLVALATNSNGPVADLARHVVLDLAESNEAAHRAVYSQPESPPPGAIVTSTPAVDADASI